MNPAEEVIAQDEGLWARPPPRTRPPVVLEQPRPQEEALRGIPMEIGIPRTPPLRKRPNLQTVGTGAAHLDSGQLDLLAAQARKLHPTVAYYPQVTLVIFGPLPKVRFFLWEHWGHRGEPRSPPSHPELGLFPRD